MTDTVERLILVHLEDAIAEEWRSILGPDWNGDLPVRSFMPAQAFLPGFDGPEDIFLLDLSRLQPAQRKLIVDKLAEKFSLPAEEAEKEVRLAGIPIRAAHVAYTSVIGFRSLI